MAARFCMACGNELAENSAFCSNCGRPVHETAQVSTPQANVPVPTPPYQQQVGSPVGTAGGVRTRYYWITFIVIAILALLIGDNGTIIGLAAGITGALWTYRDASTRGRGNPTLWAVGVFFFLIILLPIYLFTRRPLT